MRTTSDFSTYLDVDEGVLDVGRATVEDIAEDTGPRLDPSLTMLEIERRGPLLLEEVVGMTGDGVGCDGRVCEVVVPSESVGWLTKGIM